MASKRPDLTQRPSASQAADQWVQNGSPASPASGGRPPQQEPEDTFTAPPTNNPMVMASGVAPASSAREATRRLTLDLPESLHRAMKIKAATTGVTMLDEVRSLLEVHYGLRTADALA